MSAAAVYGESEMSLSMVPPRVRHKRANHTLLSSSSDNGANVAVLPEAKRLIVKREDCSDDEESEYEQEEENGENLRFGRDALREQKQEAEEEEEEENVLSEKEQERASNAELMDPVRLDAVDQDAKNKPICTFCHKMHKPGWKDVLIKLGKPIMVPAPEDDCYEFVCVNCSKNHTIQFKNTPKTYQNIISTGMYNMAFVKKGENGFFGANEIVEYLVKHKSKFPAKVPIDKDTYIRRIRSTISAFPNVFERCSKNGKRTGVRYRLAFGNKRKSVNSTTKSDVNDGSDSSDSSPSSSRSPSPDLPRTCPIENSHSPSKDVVAVDSNSALDISGRIPTAMVSLECDVCQEKCTVEWRYSSINLFILPGPADNQFSFVCKNCNKGKDAIEHKPKSWAKIMSTAIYNMGLIHTRQYFLCNEIYQFVDSHWDVIATGKLKEENWERSASSSLYSASYTKYFVSHPSKIGYWGLRDSSGKPPPNRTHFAIEKIISKKSNKAGARYFVKWAGFLDNYNTWEFADSIDRDVLEDFERLFSEKSMQSKMLPPKKDKARMSLIYEDSNSIPAEASEHSKSEDSESQEENYQPVVKRRRLSLVSAVNCKRERMNNDESYESISENSRKFTRVLRSKRKNFQHLTCSDCGKYVPIDPAKYPEAKNFVFPTPKDFEYAFLCAACNSGTLKLQHRPRSLQQKIEMARYNLQLAGDAKEISQAQILAFIENHPDDFNPEDKKDSSDDDSSYFTSDESNSESEETVSLTPVDVIKEAASDMLRASTDESPTYHHLKRLRKHSSALNRVSNTNGSSNEPEKCVRADRTNENDVKNLEKLSEGRDALLRLERQQETFGFVRIDVNASVHSLKAAIAEKENVPNEKDLLIYQQATIKMQHQQKILIKECVVDNMGQHTMLLRKHISSLLPVFKGTKCCDNHQCIFYVPPV